jgi:hypothetical protein
MVTVPQSLRKLTSEIADREDEPHRGLKQL